MLHYCLKSTTSHYFGFHFLKYSAEPNTRLTVQTNNSDDEMKFGLKFKDERRRLYMQRINNNKRKKEKIFIHASRLSTIQWIDSQVKVGEDDESDVFSVFSCSCLTQWSGFCGFRLKVHFWNTKQQSKSILIAITDQVMESWKWNESLREHQALLQSQASQFTLLFQLGSV